ncbi:hypothetical protein [Mucilaginibacter sp.]|uniref:hypothetical protein n=1 Tax=Mucilaginibacter sp. TaxID=1882438 RepID=UPI002842C407|nr:hypothetical protein [Mucilaginibacter sp.]MDR3694697.1 hypothetical protein [Mucilaginibacter sp.]
MKKHLLLFLTLILTSVSYAHAQTKVDKYCQVTIGTNNVNRKKVAKISFGENKGKFALKDSIIIKQLYQVNDLATGTDILNYMAQIGWNLVSIHSSSPWYEVFYFKRTFDSSELTP